MKRIFILAILIFAVSMANASASNDVFFKKADGSNQMYRVYEAKDIKRTVENNWMYVNYRDCKKMTAAQVIKREKLQANDNISGGIYCGLPNDSTTILLKDVRKIRDMQA